MALRSSPSTRRASSTPGRIADELVVLQNGAVVERGTESTLVADYSRRLLNTRLSTLGVS